MHARFWAPRGVLLLLVTRACNKDLDRPCRKPLKTNCAPRLPLLEPDASDHQAEAKQKATIVDELPQDVATIQKLAVESGWDATWDSLYHTSLGVGVRSQDSSRRPVADSGVVAAVSAAGAMSLIEINQQIAMLSKLKELRALQQELAAHLPGGASSAGSEARAAGSSALVVAGAATSAVVVADAATFASLARDADDAALEGLFGEDAS
jgi:hypothetical protein